MRSESAARVWDASEAAKAVRDFVADKTETEFFDDLLLRSAVERQLEILGEALSHLRNNDLDTAVRVPDLDRIVGMRNVIAHEYGDVDYEIVWAAVTKRIPGLMCLGVQRYDIRRDRLRHTRLETSDRDQVDLGTQQQPNALLKSAEREESEPLMGRRSAGRCRCPGRCHREFPFRSVAPVLL